MSDSKKYCPMVIDGDGRPVECGSWCAWYIPAQNAKYAGCAMTILAQNVKGMRLDHRPNKEGYDNMANGQSNNDKIPF